MTALPLSVAARLASALALGAALAGCGVPKPQPVPGRTVASADWKRMATDIDRERLRRWRTSWTNGVDAVRAGGKGDVLDAEGALFDPDNAIEGAVPPPGAYRCRTFKLGAKGTAVAPLTVYPAGDCRIDENGAVSSFYKLDGMQRPTGLIFHDNPSRAVFLGTLMLGDETRPVDYGRDHKRNMIGFVERVAPDRWRLVLPDPTFESLIDVIELVPKG